MLDTPKFINMRVKKTLITVLTLSLCLSVSSQNEFKKGYIINNHKEKIDCFIRNIGLTKESTMKYEYKLEDSKEINKIELSKIEEFGIVGELKCIRALISVETSDDVFTNRNDTLLQWETGHAYVNVLVEGESASLFSYHDHGKPMYYFKIKGSEITPLLFKKYTIKLASNFAQEYLFNNAYREQLKEYVSCGNQNIDKVSYEKNDLIKHFIEFNQCTKSGYTEFKNSLSKKGKFLVNLGASINNMQFRIEEFIDAAPNAVFSKEKCIGFSAGIEYLIPLNRYIFGVFTDASYSYYQSNKIFINDPISSIDESNEIVYKSISFPIGLIYYLNFDRKHRLFLKAAFVPQIILSDSYLNLGLKETFSPSSRELFGIGYKYSNLGIELGYYTPINITQQLHKRPSEFTEMSFKLTYGLQWFGDR